MQQISEIGSRRLACSHLVHPHFPMNHNAGSSADGVLDASFIVRYLTGHPREPAELAREVIDSDLHLGVTDVAIVETAYVLTSVYHKTRGDVVDALAALVQRRNIVALGAEKEYVALGLRMYRASARMSFGDAMIWAAGAIDPSPPRYDPFKCKGE